LAAVAAGGRVVGGTRTAAASTASAADRIIPVGALVVAGITWAAVWGLQSTVPGGVGTPLERAQLRVETIRTGLSVGAGAGAAAALLLALRRQQVTERTQQATEYDAGEKRVTELYVKAAEQLGSDKAPVRLAGLAALERLAQDNPAHRQSIVEVICAYLRMPYTPPAEQPSAADAAGPDQPTQPDPREERQVRLAAQRILARQLGPKAADRTPSPTYWKGVTVDLTEATLLDADFALCALNDARFDRATFTGDAGFNGATFTGDARLYRATFTGDARLYRATFTSDARFNEATFTSDAGFNEATFTGDAGFDGATFTSDAWFDGATFTSDAGFNGATFTSDAWFDGATFTSDAWFNGATFESGVVLDDASVGDGNRDRDVWPAGWQVESKTRQVVRVPVEEKSEGDAEPE